MEPLIELHPKIAQALRSYDSTTIPHTIPDSLPVIEDYAEERATKESFAGLDAVFIQHHLGSLIPKLNAMIEYGLDRSRTWFIDIPYSTCRPVVDRLRSMGVHPSHLSRPFDDPLADYSHAQMARVSFLMAQIANRDNPNPLLVIDDGAYFVRYLLDVHHHAPDLIPRFRGSYVVEQTTRGHRFIERHHEELTKAFDLHMVSIARCKTKTDFEGPFIGANIIRSMFDKIGTDRLNAARKVAVMGYGTIGRGVVERVVRDFPAASIHVVDTKWDEKSVNTLKELHCEPREKLASDGCYDVVIGCTGTNSFLVEERHFLSDNAVLVSGSSADVEFNRFAFVELADRLPNDEIEIIDREATRKQGIRANVSLRHEGGKIMTILNAGFPANFTGEGVEGLPYSIIQATHSLLFGAALQATRSRVPGFRTIEHKRDDEIFNLALEHLEI